MSRVIFFSHRELFKNGIGNGPTIRIYEMAKALSKNHQVFIAQKDLNKERKEGKITHLKWDKQLIKKIQEYDVAILQTWNDDIDFLKEITIPKVIDIYTPTLVEHSVFATKETKFEKYYQNQKIDFFFDDVMQNLSRILSHGDFFICANEKQKTYYTGILNILGIINPTSYKNNILTVVPYGVPSKKPSKKTLAPDLNPKNTLLWNGGLQPWFNANEVIKAVKLIIKNNKDFKLIFVGAQNPLDTHFTEKHHKEIQQLIKKLKLQKYVEFHDWLSYNDREKMYNSSFASICMSENSLENTISNRTRIIDSLWGNNPVITNKNSEQGNLIQNLELGEITNNNAKDIASKIIMVQQNVDKYLPNIKQFNKINTWDEVIKPLNSFCKKPFTTEKKFLINNLVSEKEKTIKVVEEQLEFLKVKFKEYDKNLDEKNAQIVQRESEIGTLKRELAKALEQNHSLIQNNNRQSNLIKNVEKENKNLHKTIQKIHKKNELSHKNIHKNYEKTIKKIHDKYEKEHTKQISAMNKNHKQEIEANNKSHKQHTLELSTQIAKLSNQIREKQELLDKISADLRESQITNTIRQEQVNHLHENLQTKEKTIIQYEEEVNKLKSMISKQNNELSNMNITLQKSLMNQDEILKIVDRQKEIILKQKEVIGKFKGSVVYPFYQVTSNVGKMINKK